MSQRNCPACDGHSVYFRRIRKEHVCVRCGHVFKQPQPVADGFGPAFEEFVRREVLKHVVPPQDTALHHREVVKALNDSLDAVRRQRDTFRRSIEECLAIAKSAQTEKERYGQIVWALYDALHGRKK